MSELWRQGTKVGNTIYYRGVFVGSAVTPGAAEALVAAANAGADRVTEPAPAIQGEPPSCENSLAPTETVRNPGSAPKTVSPAPGAPEAPRADALRALERMLSRHMTHSPRSAGCRECDQCWNTLEAARAAPEAPREERPRLAPEELKTLASILVEVGGVSMCLHCDNTIAATDLDHWEHCEKHPARARIAELEQKGTTMRDLHGAELADREIRIRELEAEAGALRMALEGEATIPTPCWCRDGDPEGVKHAAHCLRSQSALSGGAGRALAERVGLLEALAGQAKQIAYMADMGPSDFKELFSAPDGVAEAWIALSRIAKLAAALDGQKEGEGGA